MKGYMLFAISVANRVRAAFSRFLFTWKCGWGSGIPVCCILWCTTIQAGIQYMDLKLRVKHYARIEGLGLSLPCKSWSVRFLDWYHKSQGGYLHYQGWVEGVNYRPCPVCLILKRVKKIKFCWHGDTGCQDRECLGRLRIEAEKPKKKGICMRAGYSYNIRTGEEKKLDIIKAPVWPWYLLEKSYKASVG